MRLCVNSTWRCQNPWKLINFSEKLANIIFLETSQTTISHNIKLINNLKQIGFWNSDWGGRGGGRRSRNCNALLSKNFKNDRSGTSGWVKKALLVVRKSNRDVLEAGERSCLLVTNDSISTNEGCDNLTCDQLHAPITTFMFGCSGTQITKGMKA